MQGQDQDNHEPQTEGRVNETYDEEKDPSTPYLNPGYRRDLYENSCGNIVIIIVGLIAFWTGIFGYFMIFFGPLTTGIMYHDNMWWAFIIIFVATIIVCLALILSRVSLS